jgi:predicted TPR repeat methyltransferase
MFLSSDNLVADRRFEFARELAARGDFSAAADLYAQTVELAPDFAAAWCALGEMHDKLGDRAAAVAAFTRARAIGPVDRYGAGLQLARLGAAPVTAPPPRYVADLFDDYAARFDDALVNKLGYRGPALLRDAVLAVLPLPARGERPGVRGFDLALDLGCGTGLSGAAFRPHCARLIGVDLSAAMIAKAHEKNLYDALTVGDLYEFLGSQPDESVDLIVAADVFVYLAGLAAILRATARVLRSGGVIAFSVETHGGDDAIVGDKLRFAHSRAHVTAALDAAGFGILSLDAASTRNEGGTPVPGLIVVARKP